MGLARRHRGLGRLAESDRKPRPRSGPLDGRGRSEGVDPRSVWRMEPLGPTDFEALIERTPAPFRWDPGVGGRGPCDALWLSSWAMPFEVFAGQATLVRSAPAARGASRRLNPMRIGGAPTRWTDLAAFGWLSIGMPAAAPIRPVNTAKVPSPSASQRDGLERVGAERDFVLASNRRFRLPAGDAVHALRENGVSEVPVRARRRMIPTYTPWRSGEPTELAEFLSTRTSRFWRACPCSQTAV